MPSEINLKNIVSFLGAKLLHFLQIRKHKSLEYIPFLHIWEIVSMV